MRGLDLGLVDGLGDMREVLRRRYGTKVKLQLVSGGRSLFGKKVPGVNAALGLNAERLAAGAVSGLAEFAEEKALWSRFGL
jgi:ClpP class serine protease